jgi:KipI family sensor histidine kinase inhibitor
MRQSLLNLREVKRSNVEQLFELNVPVNEDAIRSLGFRICVASDCALIIYVDLDDVILANKIIKSITDTVLQNRHTSLLEYIPSYQSLFLEFNMLEIDVYEARAFVKQCLCEHSFQRRLTADLNATQDDKTALQRNSVHRIPVCYKLHTLPSDIEKVAKEKSLSIEAVIKTHSASQLQVFATGFLPGFAYLGEIDESIQIARLAQPRAKVPAGAVAIADKQTAIYPIESPGGWHILGYTPLSLLSKTSEESPLLQVGDQVQFYEISADEYQTLCKKQAKQC